MAKVFSYHSALHEIGEAKPLSEKLGHIHKVIRANIPVDIPRIAIAIYEPRDDMLKTYIHSTDTASPLTQYQQPLADVPSLKELSRSRESRVVNDLKIFSMGTATHTRKIVSSGYGSSYTVPMFKDGMFQGFIFFNAARRNAFEDETLHYLDIFAHLLTLMVSAELESLRTLSAAVKTASDMSHKRDNETGSHLDRMSHYSRLIAQGLAEKHGFDDEFIEHIFLFAPLHDIGKIGIPDNILLKPGKLDEDERKAMEQHALIGREMIDSLLDNFGLDAFYRVDLLRNIAEFHHEKLDGKGYPHGLKGEEIPIEAHIIAVADIFDALTSARPYKKAWSNDEAYALLHKLGGNELDRDCVDALYQARGEVEKVQQRYAEDMFG